MTQAVWSDVGIQNSQKVAQKIATAIFTWRMVYFKIGQKVTKYLGYCWQKIYSQEFKNSPNLDTLLGMESAFE